MKFECHMGGGSEKSQKCMFHVLFECSNSLRKIDVT